MHHADLAAGYSPADWPEAFLDAAFTAIVEDRQDGPALRLRTPDGRRAAGGRSRTRGHRCTGRPDLVAARARRRCRADGRPGTPYAGAMAMTYTGDVTPGGPPDVRELAGPDHHQVAVDPQMSNNCYLLTLPATRRAAADRRGRRAASAARAARRRPGWPPSSPPTSTGTTTARWRRWSRRPARTTVAGAPDAAAITEQTGVPIDRQRRRRRHRHRRRLHARGHPPRRAHARLDRPALRRPEPATRTCSPATPSSRAGSATRSATRRRSPSSSTTSRPRSSTGCPTTPGSTPATATTRPWAPSARISPSGAPAAGSRCCTQSHLKPLLAWAGIAGRPTPTGNAWRSTSSSWMRSRRPASNVGPCPARTGCTTNMYSSIRSQVCQRPGERDATYEQALARLQFEPLRCSPQVAPHQLGVPIDPAQCVRHDVLLGPVDGLGERDLPRMPSSQATCPWPAAAMPTPSSRRSPCRTSRASARAISAAQ